MHLVGVERAHVGNDARLGFKLHGAKAVAGEQDPRADSGAVQDVGPGGHLDQQGDEIADLEIVRTLGREGIARILIFEREFLDRWNWPALGFFLKPGELPAVGGFTIGPVAGELVSRRRTDEDMFDRVRRSWPCPMRSRR